MARPGLTRSDPGHDNTARDGHPKLDQGASYHTPFLSSVGLSISYSSFHIDRPFRPRLVYAVVWFYSDRLVCAKRDPVDTREFEKKFVCGTVSLPSATITPTCHETTHFRGTQEGRITPCTCQRVQVQEDPEDHEDK